MHVSPALVIFWGLVLTRFVLPLWIPKYPLPAILGCLVVDALDQTVFQAFTHVDLTGYQSYDKALDIFYLTVAMLSMYRNWSHKPALRIGQLLFYVRLLGVVLFELIDRRYLLFIFPNAFEYFFVFYEVLRSRWSPRRLSPREYIWVAIGIWILKLPQEYWIHMARLDFTDEVKHHVLHAPESAGWLPAIKESPISFGVMLAAFVGLWMLGRAFILHFAGPPTHALRLAAPPLPERIDEASERDRRIARSWRLFDMHLAEKIALVALITVIFAQIVPGVDTGPPKLVLGTGIIVTINAFLGLRRARAGRSPESGVALFIVVVLTNVTVAGIAEVLLRIRGGGLDISASLFFLLLTTLIVTLYDRWRPVYDDRFARAA
jgi:hypothetical protein